MMKGDLEFVRRGRLDNFRESRRVECSKDDTWKASNGVKSNGTGERYGTICRSGDIHELTQCPICLGILRNTRTVMECLHRFCRECIDKAMRLGKNECPTCRVHCASRRSLRDDPQFDALIAALYPDLEELDEEEFTLLEENLENNKQTQRRIAEVFKHQSEALGKFKRPKPVANKARHVAGVHVSRCLRAEIGPEDGRISSTGKKRIFPDLNRDAAQSHTPNTLKELCPAQQSGGRETNRAPMSTVSRRAYTEDGEQYDNGRNRLFPYKNRDGAEASISVTENELCPAQEGGENENTHGLQLLSDIVHDHEASRIMQVAEMHEGTEIKDSELPERAEGGSVKRQKRPGSTSDNLFAGSSDDSPAVHMAPGDMSDGQNEQLHVSHSPAGHRSLGTGKSNGLLSLEPVSNDGECTEIDEEETQSRPEGQNKHQHLVVVTYERTRGRGQGNAPIQRPESGSQMETPRVSRVKARPSEHGNLCARASALLNHLVAGVRNEKEKEVKPLVEHSDSEDALPCLDQPYLSCPPHMKIQHLYEYLANKISALRGRNIEILVSTSYENEAYGLEQPEIDRLHVLRLEDTLDYVLTNLWHKRGNMVLLYRGARADYEDKVGKVPT